MISRIYMAHCDECRESCEYLTLQLTQKKAIQALVAHGWKYIYKPKKLICPDCLRIKNEVRGK